MTNNRHWNAEAWGLFIQVAPSLLSDVINYTHMKPHVREYIVKEKGATIAGLFECYDHLAKIYLIEVIF